MNNNFEYSDFYCTECGNKGLPVYRRNCDLREDGHLKTLYCIYCKKETNHAEVRQSSNYTKDDFFEEFDLGRFVDGQRIKINELYGCSNSSCPFYVNGKCWNANLSYQCGHRPGDRRKKKKEEGIIDE